MLTILSDALGKAFVPKAIAQRQGLAETALEAGFVRMGSRLAERSLSAANIEILKANAEAQYAHGVQACESPIERMVLAALVTADWRSGAEMKIAVSTRRDSERPPAIVVICPQFAFVRCRVDFAISAMKVDALRTWAIECDGVDYHAMPKDRRRDAFLASWGIDAAHLTGTKIYADVHMAVSPIVHRVNAWLTPDQSVE